MEKELKTICAILSDMGIDDVSSDISLNENGIDSTERVDFIISIEEKLGINLEEDDIGNMTLIEIGNLLKERLKKW